MLVKMSGRQASMSSLAEMSGMSATAFRDALAKLSSSGFIQISGAPLSEVVSITDKGQEVAELLQ
jgi:predicted transcriptional regulator